MNFIIKKLPALVEEELEAANNIHPSFHSSHEGWAVLKEEVEETYEEEIEMEAHLMRLWRCIKENDEEEGRKEAREIERSAVHVAAEAIQVAAMARKFRAIEKSWN